MAIAAEPSAPTAPTDRYTVISSDCHAGGSHAQYREFLDPKYHEDFDAWRAKYRNPYRDLGDQRRLRNWDDEMRNSQQEGQGVIGEVVFPNTVPPFFPSFVLFARPPKPEEYEHRRAGVQAHNRWLVDWCSRFPERRAGVGQVFLNDVDDAIEDLTFIKENGLRGGVLLPNPPPDCTWVPQLFDPVLDRFWAACQDLDVPVTIHGGTGNPDYSAAGQAGMLLYINEVAVFSQRPLMHLILSGVFERFPRLKFVMTEIGCAWVVPLLRRLDAVARNIRDTGETGEIKYDRDDVLPTLPSEYFQQNVWLGVSFPGADDIAVLDEVGADRFMWGSDYPHDEGTFPHTKEHLRARFSGMDPALVHQLVAGNAARLYDFDLEALAPLAAEVGPTVAEVAEPYDGDVSGPIKGLSKDMDAKAL